MDLMLVEVIVFLVTTMFSEFTGGQGHNYSPLCPKPNSQPSTCRVDCNQDSQCEGTLRCCDSGCGLSCIDTDASRRRTTLVRDLPRPTKLYAKDFPSNSLDGSGSGFPWYWYAIIVGGVLLVIVMLIAIGVSVRRCNKKKTDTALSSGSPRRIDEDEDTYCYIQDPPLQPCSMGVIPPPQRPQTLPARHTTERPLPRAPPSEHGSTDTTYFRW